MFATTLTYLAFEIYIYPIKLVDQNDMFEVLKLDLFFVSWLSKILTLGGPQFQETCLMFFLL